MDAHERHPDDDHSYTHASALSAWHDEQLQTVDGIVSDDNFDKLEKDPDPPDALPDDALPITALANCGDVQWQSGEWPKGRALNDVQAGAYDHVFDALSCINRFAFWRFEGTDCTVGWLYTAPVVSKTTNAVKQETQVYVRTDVLKRYGDPDYCEYYDCEQYWVSDPTAYGDFGPF